MDVHRRTVRAERPDHVRLRIDQFKGEGLVGIAGGPRGILPRIGDLQRIDTGDEIRVSRIEEQPYLASAQCNPVLPLGVGRERIEPADTVVVFPGQRQATAGGKSLHGRVVDLAAGGGNQADVEIRDHEYRDRGDGARRLGLPDVLRILVGATGVEDFLPFRVGVGPGFLQPDDADGSGSCCITVHPEPELAVHLYRRLRIVQSHLTARGELELGRKVGNGIDVEHGTSHAGRNIHHQVAAALQ